MQITSGMPGAFGSVRGSIAPTTQSDIMSNYAYNIAYGSKILVDKWDTTPRIGNGDPTVLENWYFALWAYNGWGWVNNPNNPRFSRVGTPAQNPATFPYQERVLYSVQHPPRDRAGNPMWKPLDVTLPAPSVIGNTPHSFTAKSTHSQPLPVLSAVYQGAISFSAVSNSTVTIPLRVENTGALPWPSSGSLGISLTYHLMTSNGNPWSPLSPFSNGIIAFAQGQTVLPRDMLPGKSVLLHVHVHVPSAVGAYQIVWDLQQGTDTWFSQQGVLPLVTVLHAGTALPVTPTVTPPVGTKGTKTEDARYVRDTSVQDGAVMSPRQVFDKGWLLFNDGTTAWGTGWSVRHVSGSSFGLKTATLPATLPCRTVNVIATLHAPKRAGSYSGAWRVYDSNNTAVGDQFTVVVTIRGIPGSGTPTITPTPTMTVAGRSTPTVTSTPVG